MPRDSAVLRGGKNADTKLISRLCVLEALVRSKRNLMV